MQRGDRVRLTGLCNRAELNGRLGTVDAAADASGRHRVILDRLPQCKQQPAVLAKPENVCSIHEPLNMQPLLDALPKDECSAAEDTDADDLDFSKLKHIADAAAYGLELLGMGKNSLQHDEACRQAMPLLQSGSTYDANCVRFGFRVPSGHVFELSSKGRVRVQQVDGHRDTGGKPTAIVLKWPDGGLAWMYWSDDFKNSQGLPLAECATQYGLGGWTDPKNGVQMKVVHLDSTHSCKPGCCFLLAIRAAKLQGSVQRPDPAQDAADGVYRVYRSDVPPQVQNVIKHATFRQVSNAKGNEYPEWWFM